jgi:hypothetical protein
MSGPGASTARIVLLQGERETEHYGRDQSEEAKRIDIGKCLGMLLDHHIEPRVGLPVRLVRAQTRHGKTIGEDTHLVLKHRVVSGNPVHEVNLMELRAPGGADIDPTSIPQPCVSERNNAIP